MSASTSSGLVSHDATAAATSVVSFKHTRKPRRKKTSSNKSSPRKQLSNISYEFFAENEEAAQILYQVLVRRPTNNEMKPPQLIDDRWVIACTEHQLSRRICDVSSINNFFYYYWTESEPDAGGLCAFIRAKDKAHDHALVLLKENKYILRCTKWGFDFFDNTIDLTRFYDMEFMVLLTNQNGTGSNANYLTSIERLSFDSDKTTNIVIKNYLYSERSKEQSVYNFCTVYLFPMFFGYGGHILNYRAL
uniref:Uncharacterized protein n=1 Tax=Cacopsylla melanoneura TaxID=428564 RepID=A0A8D8M1U6_9HEMI